MARSSLRRPENVPGEFWVDATCIDCDTCRWMAPETFEARGEQAAVHAQPADDAARLRALMALVSCPTASIGTTTKQDLAPAFAALPAELADGVYHCGYHHEQSFGAASYLIVRPAGNVLVDAPRFAGPLVRRLEQLGGVRTLFLTHRDDVADHARFAAHFGCARVLHAADAAGDAALSGVERLLEGDAPLRLDDELEVLPVPGHTRGSAVLRWRGRFLFTGDHLAWSTARARLIAFRDACWFDWPTQIASMRRLLDWDFEWVLPGHGHRVQLPAPRMRAEVERCLAWMESRR